MQKAGTYILSVLAIMMWAGCNNSDNTTGAMEPLEREPDIVGELTQINEGEEGKVHPSILVEEDTTVQEPSEPGGRKIWFILTEEATILIRQEDGTLSEANIQILEVGQKVEGWIRGVVIETFPAQGEAQRIVVIRE